MDDEADDAPDAFRTGPGEDAGELAAGVSADWRLPFRCADDFDPRVAEQCAAGMGATLWGCLLGRDGVMVFMGDQEALERKLRIALRMSLERSVSWIFTARSKLSMTSFGTHTATSVDGC